MITKYLSIVLIVLMACSSSYADTCTVNQYKKKLTKIGIDKVSSVVLASDELIKLARNRDDKCKENLIYIFREYYHKALEAYDFKFNAGDHKYPLKDSEIVKINSSISKVGWVLKETEGIYYIGQASGWFENKLKAILTESYRRYFILRSKEIKEGFSEDAILMISWEQLKNRIIGWEQFLNTYPQFVEKTEINKYLNVYIRTFLSGMDNSRINGFDTKKLRPEVKSAYEQFIRENKKSLYYNTIKDYYEMLKNNDFVVPENIDEYLELKGYKTMLRVQPPTY